MASKRIVIAGETYSSNLGDGVIFETLSHLFTLADQSILVSPLDISGRVSWAEAELKDASNIKNNRFMGQLSTASALGLTIRNSLRTNPDWIPILNEAELLVIGGGKLLMDHRLNFPVKLNNLRRAANRFGVPVHFSACGVGENWSPIAVWLFKRLLSQAVTISLRDNQSQKRLAELIPGIACSVTFDPGMWAADVYGPNTTPQDEQVIGLGVIHLQDVNFYRPAKAALLETDLLDAWLGIISVFHNQGIKFEIFTNGNPDDYEFAHGLFRAVQTKLSIPCKLATRPTKPIDLARGISKYSGVIASRLHANIIAASYQIPSIGLVWDEKIRAFYNSIHRPRNVFPLIDFIPEKVIEVLLDSIRTGVDAAMVERAKKRALLSVEMVLQDF
ncbi:MAG: polysaccharide pyruvyl transferase family protein [Chloroflexi bacterium]|nr:polysaccharide pyruvyl transferase family protein [Chloroflexota bacterium]